MIDTFAHPLWQVVEVPTVEAEDQHHLHRDLETCSSG